MKSYMKRMLTYTGYKHIYRKQAQNIPPIRPHALTNDKLISCNYYTEHNIRHFVDGWHSSLIFIQCFCYI